MAKTTNGKKKVIFFSWIIVITALAVLWANPTLRAQYHIFKAGNNLDLVWVDKQVMPCEITNSTDQSRSRLLQEAEAHLNRAAILQPSISQIYLLLGRVSCLSDDTGAAINNYETYTTLRPDNPLGKIELGFAYDKKGNYAKAGAAWSAAEIDPQLFLISGYNALYHDDNPELALQQAFRVLAMDDTDASAHILGSRALATSGDPGDADQWLQAGLARIKTVHSYLNEANRAIKNDDYELARLILNEAITQFPDSTEALVELANLHLVAGQIELVLKSYHAIRAYQHVIAIGLNNVQLSQAYFGLGKAIHQQEHNLEKASEYFHRAVDLQPDNGNLFFEIALIFAEAQLHEEADWWFESAILREPGINWWSLRRADVARQSGDLKQAIELYKATIQSFPTYPLAYHQIAWAYYLADRISDAVIAIETSQRLYQPNIPEWSFLRAGLIYEANQDFEKAIQAYQSALAINPELTEAIQALDRISGR